MRDVILSLLVLAALLLGGGGIYAWARGTNRKQAALMVICALVMLANALLIGLPTQ